MPLFNFESALSILIFLVSDILLEVTQQIHSLRARGVMSCQSSSTFGLEARAFRKSSGILCTVPAEILPFFFVT